MPLGNRRKVASSPFPSLLGFLLQNTTTRHALCSCLLVPFSLPRGKLCLDHTHTHTHARDRELVKVSVQQKHLYGVIVKVINFKTIHTHTDTQAHGNRFARQRFFKARCIHISASQRCVLLSQLAVPSAGDVCKRRKFRCNCKLFLFVTQIQSEMNNNKKKEKPLTNCNRTKPGRTLERHWSVKGFIVFTSCCC